MKAGVRVGLGVDGSASNDGSHLLAEARQAMLLSRLGAGIAGASRSADDAAPLMTARQALELATIGGARVLGRSDIGSLEVGKCADFIVIDLNRLEYTGALIDPVAAVLFCQPVAVTHTVVGGEFVVRNGELMNFDLKTHIQRHQKAAKRLISPEG